MNNLNKNLSSLKCCCFPLYSKYEFFQPGAINFFLPNYFGISDEYICKRWSFQQKSLKNVPPERHLALMEGSILFWQFSLYRQIHLSPENSRSCSHSLRINEIRIIFPHFDTDTNFALNNLNFKPIFNENRISCSEIPLSELVKSD